MPQRKDQPYVLGVHVQQYRRVHAGGVHRRHVWRPFQLARPGGLPINALIIRALLSLYRYYGKAFTIECLTGSGVQMTLFEVAEEPARRRVSTFLNDANGRRSVFGGASKFQDDPNWHDCILFYEYFHGDNGAVIGASHQIAWTRLGGMLIEFFGYLDPHVFLETMIS